MKKLRRAEMTKLNEMLAYERMEINEYLVELRDSGVVNMFGAGAYLKADFGLDRRDANHAVALWMTTFTLPKNEQPDDGR